MSFKKARKGRFKPRFPEKYLGNAKNIIYRSSLELQLMLYLDKHSKVLAWKSEEFSIPYVSPLDGKVHRYFPDFWIKLDRGSLGVEELVVEIKPYSQTQQPKEKKKTTRHYITEVATWGVNESKWIAARAWCAERGYKFVIMTEKDLGLVS